MSDDSMVPRDGMNHFGHELKAERERQSLPLAQVATLIRVREAYLDAIERHDWDAAPEPVFTRGYIQSYAQFLHLDPNLFLNAYARELRIARASQPPAEQGEDETKALLERLARTQGQDNSGFWWRSRWMVLVLVGGFAGGAAFWFAPKLPSAHAEEPAAIAESQEEALVPTSEAEDHHEAMLPSEPPSAKTSTPSSGSRTSPPAGSVRHSLWAWSEHSSNEDSTAHPVWTWSERSSSSPEEEPSPEKASSSRPASMLPSTALAALDVPPTVRRHSEPASPAPPTIAAPASGTTHDEDPGDGRIAIEDFGVGTGVSGRQLVGRSDHFDEGTTVWFWTRVMDGHKGDSIRHVWLRDGRVMGTVHLSVGGPQWRTQSRWQLGAGTAGSWTVEARDADDRVLASATFRCEPS